MSDPDGERQPIAASGSGATLRTMRIPVADAWASVGGLGSAAAAIAAVFAVIYSRRTVGVATDTLKATKTAIAEAHRAHADEMAERANALSEEIRFQRLRQIERVLGIVSRLGELVEQVRGGAYFAPKQLSFKQHQLRAALGVLLALGGPELPKCRFVVDMPTDNMAYVDDALDELAVAVESI